MYHPRHPHLPHQHQPHEFPHNPPFSEDHPSMPNLITDRDHELLKELLDNPEEADSIFHMLENSPPEMAVLGYLVLRVFERVQSSK